jgi:hypothetical protein
MLFQVAPMVWRHIWAMTSEEIGGSRALWGGQLYRNQPALDNLPAPRRPFHNPKLSFTAIAISCSDPRYRSVVWIEE